jgi:hypothetical protein
MKNEKKAELQAVKMAEAKEEDLREVELRIERKNPKRLLSEYVNDLVVTHSEKEVFITFSQIEPPAFLSGEDIEDIKSIEAIAISKLIVTPEFAEKIINTLTKNLRKRKERLENV